MTNIGGGSTIARSLGGTVRFEGNYIRRGHLDVADVAKIAAALAGLSEDEWREDSYRQQTFATHRDTNTVPLLFDTDFRHTDPTRCKSYQTFASVIEPVHAAIATCFGDSGWMIRSMFARLPPGGEIPPHIDRGFSLTNSHRLHIAVVTNPAAGFSVGNEQRHLARGEVWEINNQRRHAAWNRGSQGRIHLICDWVPAT